MRTGSCSGLAAACAEAIFKRENNLPCLPPRQVPIAAETIERTDGQMGELRESVAVFYYDIYVIFSFVKQPFQFGAIVANDIAAGPSHSPVLMVISPALPRNQAGLLMTIARDAEGADFVSTALIV
jgi:hypothetical protein